MLLKSLSHSFLSFFVFHQHFPSPNPAASFHQFELLPALHKSSRVFHFSADAVRWMCSDRSPSARAAQGTFQDMKQFRCKGTSGGHQAQDSESLFLPLLDQGNHPAASCIWHQNPDSHNCPERFKLWFFSCNIHIVAKNNFFLYSKTTIKKKSSWK